jgi:hypothetical protein
MDDPEGFGPRWQEGYERGPDCVRDSGGFRRASAELPPEPHGIAQVIHGRPSQPAVFVVQDKGFATRLQAVTIPEQNGLADVPHAQPKPPHRAGERPAGRQTDEVVRERQCGGLVEVVDPPNEPSLRVAPSAKILEMEIADRKDLGHLV